MHEVTICASVLHQRLGRSVLYDATSLQHDDAIKIAQRRQAVSNRDDRAMAHQSVERLTHGLLGFRVECGCRLIEQQDRRVLEESPGNGDALPLPRRKLHPRFPTGVAKPCGRASMKSPQRAAWIARITSSSEASERP